MRKEVSKKNKDNENIKDAITQPLVFPKECFNQNSEENQVN